MGKTREQFHEALQALCTLCGIEDKKDERHVYFRKPSSSINYPCILYDLSDKLSEKADNIKYIKYNRYTVTIIDEDPDSFLSEMCDDAFKHCEMDRTYQSDGLNHFVYTIYY